MRMFYKHESNKKLFDVDEFRKKISYKITQYICIAASPVKFFACIFQDYSETARLTYAIDFFIADTSLIIPGTRIRNSNPRLLLVSATSRTEALLIRPTNRSTQAYRPRCILFLKITYFCLKITGDEYDKRFLNSLVDRIRIELHNSIFNDALCQDVNSLVLFIDSIFS